MCVCAIKIVCSKINVEIIIKDFSAIHKSFKMSAYITAIRN